MPSTRSHRAHKPRHCLSASQHWCPGKIRARGLGVHEGRKLVPCGEFLDITVPAEVRNGLVGLMSGQKRQKLSHDCVRRSPVRELWLRGDTVRHGRARPVLRQHLRRAALAERQIREGLSARLRDRCRREPRPGQLLPVLQRRTVIFFSNINGNERHQPELGPKWSSQRGTPHPWTSFCATLAAPPQDPLAGSRGRAGRSFRWAEKGGVRRVDYKGLALAVCSRAGWKGAVLLLDSGGDESSIALELLRESE